MSNLDDMYHVCRWCKWYIGGKCVNEAFSKEIDTTPVYQVAESGKLSEIISETLGSISTKKIQAELREKLEGFKLSDKRISEVMDMLSSEITEWIDKSCKPELDEAISGLYQGEADTAFTSVDGGVEIADPESFYCKEFW